MKKLIFPALVLLIISSCSKNKDENASQKTTVDSSAYVNNDMKIEPNATEKCYIGVVAKDSVLLSLEDNLGTITGKLAYKNFEKDSSFGDVFGNEVGDTIKLTYTFNAEGSTSEKEIYFLKKENHLLEGIGSQKTEGTKSTYIQPKSIKYDDGFTLKSSDCNVVKKALEQPLINENKTK